EMASLANEHNAVLLSTPEGKKILFIQIAGLIARRIACWVEKGDLVERGQRFGLIRFGSRVDIYLPLGVKLHVSLGDKTKAGTTILGVLK
ncbi:MAG: phosphatidylserine decarboxylase, partial [Nitrospirota bacterium]